MEDKQVNKFMEMIGNYVDDNFIIEDICERCGDSAYIRPDSHDFESAKKFLLEIKGLLKLNTLKGFLNDN